MIRPKKIAKSLLKKGQQHVYHREKNLEALKILKTLENKMGKLSSKNKRLCKEYALDVFGNKKYTPWLMTYCAYSHQFKEGWIPDNYYGAFVIPALKGDYGKICNRTLVINKLINHKHSSDLGYQINNLFFNTNDQVIKAEDFKKFLFKNDDRIVFKTENSFQGKGIYFFNIKTFNIEFVKQLGNGVFQSFIKQHSFFNKFNDSAVATIRLTSVCNDNGEIEVRAAYFKYGGKNETHVKSASAIYISVNVGTGTLHNMATLPDWTPVDKLPNNNIKFAGMELPCYNKCVEEIKNLHKKIPYIRCIGWDLILDENENIKIIELNGLHNTISLHEMEKGPCFKGLGWEKLHKSTNLHS